MTNYIHTNDVANWLNTSVLGSGRAGPIVWINTIQASGMGEQHKMPTYVADIKLLTAAAASFSPFGSTSLGTALLGGTAWHGDLTYGTDIQVAPGDDRGNVIKSVRDDNFVLAGAGDDIINVTFQIGPNVFLDSLETSEGRIIDGGAGDSDTLLVVGNHADYHFIGNALFNESGKIGTLYNIEYILFADGLHDRNGIKQAAQTAAAGSTKFTVAATAAYAVAGMGTMTITGSKVADIIYAGSGNKTINGGAGDDVIRIVSDGGAPGNNVIDGGTGADIMIGGAANDVFKVDNPADVTADVGGLDRVESTAANYILGAGIENLTLLKKALSGTGNSLNNIVIGNTGVNTIAGLEGDDKIYGGAGNDILIGDAGDDLLFGELGNDILIGGAGADTLTGGGGVDTASYVDDVIGIFVNMNLAGAQSGGHAQGDILIGITNVIGGSSDDWIIGNTLANRLEGGAGDDNIDGGPGNDILVGGANTSVGDTVDYTSAGSGVTVNLSLTTAQDTKGAGIDTLLAFENIYGSVFDDRLAGDGSVNVIDGAAGNDILTGDAGNDTLRGDLGDDLLFGGTGGDILDGGDGGADTASYANAATGVLVNMLNTTLNIGEAAGDTYINIEAIWGSRFADTLIADNSGIQLVGDGGDDILVGGDQNNTDRGDVLIGGPGNDALTGGLGRDQFFFTSAANGLDTITDFVSGTDSFIFGNFDPGGAAGFGLTAAADGGTGPAHFSGAHLLAADYFVTGKTANAAHAQFIFDTSVAGHHTLYFDPDGTGSKGVVAIADVLNSNVTLADLGYFI